VEVEKAIHSVNMLCRVLKVSASGYYAWRGREPSCRERADAELRKEIVSIHSASRETYGAPACTPHCALGAASAAPGSVWRA